MAEEVKNQNVNNPDVNNTQNQEVKQPQAQQVKEPTLFEQAQKTESQQVSEHAKNDVPNNTENLNVGTLAEIVSQLTEKLEKIEQSYQQLQQTQNQAFIETKIKELGLPDDVKVLIDSNLDKQTIEQRLMTLKKLLASRQPAPTNGGVPTGSEKENMWKQFIKQLTN